MTDDTRKVIYLDQVFTKRGAVAAVREDLEALWQTADDGLDVADDPKAHRAELQQLVAQAKDSVKGLEVDLLILEAFETGRWKRVRSECGEDTVEIDEDLIVQRLGGE